MWPAILSVPSKLHTLLPQSWLIICYYSQCDKFFFLHRRGNIQRFWRTGILAWIRSTVDFHKRLSSLLYSFDSAKCLSLPVSLFLLAFSLTVPELLPLSCPSPPLPLNVSNDNLSPNSLSAVSLVPWRLRISYSDGLSSSVMCLVSSAPGTQIRQKLHDVTQPPYSQHQHSQVVGYYHFQVVQSTITEHYELQIYSSGKMQHMNGVQETCKWRMFGFLLLSTVYRAKPVCAWERWFPT